MADKEILEEEAKNQVPSKASFTVSSKDVSSKEKKTITISLPSMSLKNKFKKSKFKFVFLIILVIIVSGISGFLGSYFQNDGQNFGKIGVGLSNQEKIVTSQSKLISSIAKTVGPSVVSVNVNIQSKAGSTPLDGFGLFGFSQPEEEQAAGTGIILTSNGLILTNRHVVPVGTTKVSVTLSNGVQLNDVKIIGRTPQSSSLDIAFLKIENLKGQKLTPAVIGNSSNVQIGQSVVAIGNALGQFHNTVTSGIISGFGRNVEASSSACGSGSVPINSTFCTTEDLTDLFQTDAAINEGNSGGPLVNMNGQVIGINTAIAGGAQNIGFAIPINDVIGLINQVLKTGKFSVPYIGIRYIPLTADVADEYKLSVINGAFIAPSSDSSLPSIIPGSPAAQAGLKVGDIIVAVNGTNINQNNSLTGLLYQYSPGQTVNLKVINGKTGNESTVSIKLGSEPSN
jgi:serine protease Do